MRKDAVTVPAEPLAPLPPLAEPEEGKIPLGFHALFARAKQQLPAVGRTCYALEIPPENAWRDPSWRVFDIPLENGGRVTEIFNVERWARSNGLIESCEKCTGPGFILENN